MQLLQLTLDSPAANLALDEALLEAAEAQEDRTGDVGETLRLWEPADDFIVLGRSSALNEVHLPACRRDAVRVYRRASGGGVVAAGPGCLMYSVVLNQSRLQNLRDIDAAHRYVLERLAAAVRRVLSERPELSKLAASVQQAGTSDLSFQVPGELCPRKFSGNSLRLKRRHLLYHGTLLYDFDLAKISRWLAAPLRIPAYRGQRTHSEFVANLPVPVAPLIAALVDQWQAATPLRDWPRERAQALARAHYQAIA